MSFPLRPRNKQRKSSAEIEPVGMIPGLVVNEHKLLHWKSNE